jgi:hypothetical protein
MSVEHHAVISQAVELGALYILVAIATEGVSTLVIGKKKYNIWSFLSS